MPPIRRTIKNVVHNFSDSQIKVREATSNDPWGPSSTLMAEIADLTYNVVAFSEIMQMIWKRLNDHGKNWRHVYKALTLLDYLIKTGSEKVAQQCKENIFAIQTLKDFMYVEENKDQGVNVREKAKQLVSLLKDDERLKNERARALKAKERFAQTQGGFSSKDVERTAGESGATTPTMPTIHTPPDFAAHNSGGSTVFGSGHRQRTLSEIEAARPSTVGEEELQLQLALAISKEEADDEEKKKRADALRLDMAIAESKSSTDEPKIASQGTPSRGEVSGAGASQLLDLSVDQSAGGAAAAAPLNDPWSSPAAASAQHEKKDDEAWLSLGGATGGASSSDPWGLPPPASVPPPEADPWGAPVQPTSRTTSPWADPVAPTTNGKSSPWESPATVNPVVTSDLFDLSGLEPAIAENPSSRGQSNQGSPAHGVGKPKRSPEDFLGANSALVNLDALVAGAKKQNDAGLNDKCTNPFASTTLSTVPGTTNVIPAANPFLTPSTKGVPMNQMKTQTAWGNMGGPAVQAATPPALAPTPPMSQGPQQVPPPFMGSTPLVPSLSGVGVNAPGKSSPFAPAPFGNAGAGSGASTDASGNPFLL